MKKTLALSASAIFIGALVLSSCSSSTANSTPDASQLVAQGCAAWHADHTDEELANMNAWEDLENALGFWSQASQSDGSYSDLSTAAVQSLTWLKMDSQQQRDEVSANSPTFQNVQNAVSIMQGYCGTN